MIAQRYLPPQAVSRETRDTLFLLAVMAWTAAPHVPHLPWWCSVGTGLAMLWRARCAVRGTPLPSHWALTLSLCLALVLTWHSFGTLLGKEPGLTLIVVLTALKTLELRARRDAMVVFFLGFFLILTQFLYAQSLLYAVIMTIAVWGWLSALTLAHMPSGRPSLRSAIGVAGKATLYGMPTMILLFMFFPRIAPLWGVPDDAKARTGLSDTLQMGDVADLALDDSIALRMRPLPGGAGGASGSARLAPALLYFRATVLDQFDGKTWHADETRDAQALQLRGQALTYEITYEPTTNQTWALLEATLTVQDDPASPIASQLQSALQWHHASALTQRTRLRAQAWTEFHLGPFQWTNELNRDLQLPLNSNPRSMAWAQSLRSQPALIHADATHVALALLRYLRSNPFRYTLSPGTYGKDAIDEFWLDRRAGFCEHYAASFVFMLRAMGVPARIVTGYQGAQFNNVGGYYVVRNSDAHAWAEYWQEGRGWSRADPTAAVDPQRIDSGLALRAEPGLFQAALGRLSPNWLGQWRAAWDAANNAWNQQVLNYSSQQQFKLLERMGSLNPDTSTVASCLIGVVTVLSMLGLIWAWRARFQRDPWLHTLARVQQAFRQAGWVVPAHTDPAQLAAKLGLRPELSPDLVLQARRELLALDRLRYGPPQEPALHNWQMRARLRQHRIALKKLAQALQPP